MQFQLDIIIKQPDSKISYGQKVLLTGSCFTEHIGNALQDLKFDILQNPNGILFDPASVCSSIISYIQNKQYTEADLFQLNEVWNSWQHHSRFSHIDKKSCLQHINESRQKAHGFLKEADWLVITLGSSFRYKLTDLAAYSKASPFRGGLEGAGVANCHRAPANWFTKHLLEIDETVSMLDTMFHHLKEFNPKLKIIFTVSPVRHIRDGVVENNRSKARLIEAVHHIANKFDNLYYFPAYELVIDILRDYRFYDIDLVHPNYAATEFVMEKFSKNFIDEPSQQLMEEVRKVIIARKHKAFQPDTNAHKQFLQSYSKVAKELMAQNHFLNLKEELNYFSSGGTTL